MKQTYSLRLLLVMTVITLVSCHNSKDTNSHLEFFQSYASAQYDSCISNLQRLSATNSTDENKNLLKAARKYFKNVEHYALYIQEEAARKVNGPALPVFREDNGKVLPPVGFQIMAEHIFSEDYNPKQFEYEINVTIGFLNTLKKQTANTPFIPKRYFISSEYQLLNILSWSITGFDTPTAQIGLEEAMSSLNSFKTIYIHTLSDTIQSIDNSLDQKLQSSIEEAMSYLAENNDFKTFNRYKFIREKFNPITRTWLEVRKASGLWKDDHSTALNLNSPTFFEENTFNIDNFRSSANREPSDAKIRLGKQLFLDPKLSKNGKTACVSCHIPEYAYSDQLAKAVDNNQVELERNTPTLINSIFQRRFFWDARSENMEQQINNVFVNKREFNSEVHQISTEILDDSTYARQMNEVFGRVRNDNYDIIKAISSYVSSLNSFNSKFDRNMRNEESTFSDQEVQGMNLFMGKALCASCHFVPLFNGTVPPVYSDTEREILGVPEDATNKSLDNDIGFYNAYKEDVHKYMFKTPTIRNVEYTAPYMHNGAYTTLEEVMDFYNKGGGNGLGFNVEYQTLPFDSLSLSNEDQQAIIAFMKTLSDPIEAEAY
ncbi:cytochrome-c peroxidase [Fulvivirga ligni]|uniref:cytochrome-c peroxidase n=1 Tax=Fulvivirga ligni TaxID=2904246 RepID=UPI001F34F76E|nr:cytochrome c peroxidase [Fulvivirga ligni]UII20401.1 hypothetical protein LVD16_21400 [Fulvivirga ligni]